jgi:lysozyme
MTSKPLSLRALLIAHEGLKLKVYNDTKGIPTIGYGRNLGDVGISQDEADYLLDNDIKRVCNDCWHHLPWFGDLPEEKQFVIIDMVFNLGIYGFLKFKKMIAALEKGDYAEAAAQIIDSQLAPNRKAELAAIMARKD